MFQISLKVLKPTTEIAWSNAVEMNNNFFWVRPNVGLLTTGRQIASFSPEKGRHAND
jgi:hypothetical protein